MAYITYSFYRDVYGGALDEAAFCRYLARAGYVLDALTQNRVKSLFPNPDPQTADAVSMAAGAVVDGLARQEESGGRTVVLEAVGKHRIGYASTVQDAARALRRQVAPYLQGVRGADGQPLMSRALGGRRPPA